MDDLSCGDIGEFQKFMSVRWDFVHSREFRDQNFLFPQFRQAVPPQKPHVALHGVLPAFRKTSGLCPEPYLKTS